MSKFRDFEKYEVFENGRIWSYRKNKFLKPWTNKDGYQQVRLTDNEGKCKWYYLHRIVYETFSGEPIPPNMQVNHIDEKKDNNAVSNLNLMSPKQNTNWGTGIQRRAKTQSKVLINNPKRSKAVCAFKNEKLVMSFPSTKEAERNGFYSSAVSACCNGKWTHYKGYTWKYL